MNGAEERMNRTVAVATLGCKLNQFESEAILSRFRLAGYDIAEDAETADVCVINTCAVTAAAERKSRALLRSMRRRNSNAVLMAVGCMSESNPDTLKNIGGVNVILGNCEKEHILDFLPNIRDDSNVRVFVGETNCVTAFPVDRVVSGLRGRTRGFLKVQDGCSQRCTYCIIPKLRGRGRSLPIPAAVEQAKVLVDHGYEELVLTGVALGTYGSDLEQGDTLPNLLRALVKLSGLRRIRLGSVEPWALDERLIDVMADTSVICPHLHLPMQSGDDVILRWMNRRYTTSQVARLLDYARSKRDDWGFGADIITGFPGEGITEFRRTSRFLTDSQFSYLHVFPYSSRPGTPALKLSGHVNDTEKKSRVGELRALDSALRLRFREKHLGSFQKVLLESKQANGFIVGHTPNYLDVFVEADENIAGSLRKVFITGLHPAGVVGRVVK